MSELLAGLSAEQREAVLASDGPVLILAGAGSGKTRVITHRIAHLVLDRGVPAEAILAVTFTNKAAGEMKDRAERLVGRGALQSWISTFHSLCVRLLRREASAAGLARDFVIYDEDDQLAAVREAISRLDLSEKLNPPRRLLSRISARKNSRRPPKGAPATPPPATTARASDGPVWQIVDEGPVLTAEVAEADADESLAAALVTRVAERYQAILDAAGALDFDDLLLRAVALLDSRADVRSRYQARFRYVLVDEYQDTNHAQYTLVRHLVGATGNLTVVGDEDQSIYSWRGADIRNILDFERDYPGARVLRLEDNYRSCQPILDVAASLVSHNLARKGKTLRAVKTAGEPVRLHEASDEFHEAAWVVGRIAHTPGRAAVLLRMNAQSRLFEEALLRQGIAYTVVGGVAFYQRKEVKDILAYLRLVQNPNDAVAFRRILNVPPRGIGPRTLGEIERVADSGRVSLSAALVAVAEDTVLPARATAPLRRFDELITGLRGESATLGVDAFVKRVLEQTGYGASLSQEESRESQDRLANLAELMSAAADYVIRTEGGGLFGFLDEIALVADADAVREDARVVLMTLHAAKGLEFDSVFLAGMEEGLVPHSRAVSEAALEEERRLCYVGMTRARERLHLSWGLSRSVFGQRRATTPSRFLNEIPRQRLTFTSDLPRQAPRASGWDHSDRDWRPAGRAQSTASRSVSVEAALAPPASGSTVPGGIRPGLKVRHPLFGVGTVLRLEGAGDDLKLTVSFLGVGAKRLVARYAGLELL